MSCWKINKTVIKLKVLVMSEYTANVGTVKGVLKMDFLFVSFHQSVGIEVSNLIESHCRIILAK